MELVSRGSMEGVSDFAGDGENMSSEVDKLRELLRSKNAEDGTNLKLILSACDIWGGSGACKVLIASGWVLLIVEVDSSMDTTIK